MHYAIFFGQVKIIEYLVKEMHMNLKVCFDQPYTSNEYARDEDVARFLDSTFSLYGFYIAILSRNRDTLKFLYEDMFNDLQTDEFDV